MLAIYAPGPFRRVANLNGIWIECIILYELPFEAKKYGNTGYGVFKSGVQN